MNNRVGVLTVTFNEANLIGPCVRQFKKPYCEESFFHIVLDSTSPWRGNHEWDAGKTSQVAEENGADMVFQKNWANQAEQFNFGLRYLEYFGFEWAIICDADEFYAYHDIDSLISIIEGDIDAEAIRSNNMHVYWKRPIFKIIPKQTDDPLIAIRTDKRFVDKRSSDAQWVATYGIPMHHFSYVRSDEDMRKKIDSFEHSDEFDRDEWYNTVWLDWYENMTNLHPVVPSQFQQAIYYPAPGTIINNYYGNKVHNI